MSTTSPPVPAFVDQAAPTLSFDSAPALAHRAGVFSIVLAVGRPTVMTDGTLPLIPHVVCQLQCSRDGLVALKGALDKLLLVVSEPTGKGQ